MTTDDLDIPTFALPAELEQQLQAARRPALERTGPRSVIADDAAVAERDNRGQLFPSRRLGRKGGRVAGDRRAGARAD